MQILCSLKICYLIKLAVMKKKRFILLTIFVVSLVFFNKCVKEKKQFNVIVFTLDTTRADFVDTGLKFRAKANTPTMRKIAMESYVFKNAFTVAPITMPAHTSLFTGKYPYETGVYNNGEKYDGRYKTLAQLFKEKGYKTGAVISLGVLKKKFNLSFGFDDYLDNTFSSETKYFAPANIVTEKGLELLKKYKNSKFFVWLHYSDPHEPYAPPKYKSEAIIKFNGKVVDKFNLFYVERIEMNLFLRKGRNIMSFSFEKNVPEIISSPPLIMSKMKIFLNGNDEKKDIRKIMKFVNITFRKTKNNERILYQIGKDSKIIFHSEKEKNIKLEFTVRPNIKIRTKRLLYKEEVEYMDSQIKKIIEFLKDNNIYRNTLLVFVGDHGEGLGEYMLNFGHVRYLNPQYIKVPFIIKFPFSSKRKVVRRNVSTKSLYMILKSYLLKKEIVLPKPSILYQFTYTPESVHDGIGVLMGKYFYINYYNGKDLYEEFFDLKKKNGYRKNHNFIGESSYRDVVKILRAKFRNMLKVSKRKEALRDDSEETIKMLKSLGYL